VAVTMIVQSLTTVFSIVAGMMPVVVTINSPPLPHLRHLPIRP